MTTFGIECESAGLLFETRLNNVRIYRELTGVPRIREDRVNHWMIPGENILELLLGAPAGSTDERSCAVEWLAWDDNETRRDASAIATYRWNQELTLPEGTTRRAWDAQHRVKGLTERWAWQDAECSEVNAEDRTRILNLFRELHALVSKKDITAVRRRLALQNDEMARAHGLSPGDRDERQKEFLLSCVNASRWRLEPLSPETLTLTAQADGRLVFVADPSGLPPIRGMGAAVTFDLPAVVSKIGGQWTIVR